MTDNTESGKVAALLTARQLEVNLPLDDVLKTAQWIVSHPNIVILSFKGVPHSYGVESHNLGWNVLAAMGHAGII